MSDGARFIPFEFVSLSPQASTSLDSGQSDKSHHPSLYLGIVIMHPLTQPKHGGAAGGSALYSAAMSPPGHRPHPACRERPPGHCARGGAGSGQVCGVHWLCRADGGGTRPPRDVRAPQSDRRSPRKTRVSWLASNPGAVWLFPWPTAAESRGRKDEVGVGSGGRVGAASPLGLNAPRAPRPWWLSPNGRCPRASTGCGGQGRHCACARGVEPAAAHPVVCGICVCSPPVPWNFRAPPSAPPVPPIDRAVPRDRHCCPRRRVALGVVFPGTWCARAARRGLGGGTGARGGYPDWPFLHRAVPSPGLPDGQVPPPFTLARAVTPGTSRPYYPSLLPMSSPHRYPAPEPSLTLPSTRPPAPFFSI